MVAGSNTNLSVTVPADDEYSFVFDASFIDNPNLTVWTTKTFGATPVFLRGAMNGWGQADTMVYAGNSVYSVNISLIAGSYAFKVASADWAAVNLGAQVASDVIPLNSGYVLLPGSNDNLSVNIATDGIYKFEVTGPDPLAPTLVVSPVP